MTKHFGNRKRTYTLYKRNYFVFFFVKKYMYKMLDITPTPAVLVVEAQ